jgi:hypothetical protein
MSPVSRTQSSELGSGCVWKSEVELSRNLPRDLLSPKGIDGRLPSSRLQCWITSCLPTTRPESSDPLRTFEGRFYVATMCEFRCMPKWLPEGERMPV